MDASQEGAPEAAMSSGSSIMSGFVEPVGW